MVPRVSCSGEDLGAPLIEERHPQRHRAAWRPEVDDDLSPETVCRASPSWAVRVGLRRLGCGQVGFPYFFGFFLFFYFLFSILNF
jgi:hypothetical protein